MVMFVFAMIFFNIAAVTPQSSQYAKSHDCCFKLTISSNGSANASTHSNKLMYYSKSDNDINNRIAYYKVYRTLKGTFVKSHFFYNKVNQRWEINDITDLSQASTFRFPCDANCPENCHNSSQFDYYSNNVWKKDPNLEVACKPIDCQWQTWSVWNCSMQECNNKKDVIITRNRTYDDRFVNETYCRKFSNQYSTCNEQCNFIPETDMHVIGFIVAFGVIICFLLSGLGLYYKRKELFKTCFNNEDDQDDDDYDDDYAYDAVYQRNSQINRSNSRNRRNESSDCTIETHESDRGEVLSRVQNPYYTDRSDSSHDAGLEIVQRSNNIYYETSLTLPRA